MSFTWDLPAPPSPSLAALQAAIGSDTGVIAGDLALVWASATADGDLSLIFDAANIATDLATDRGLITAALLSVFLDRRAENDDVSPSGDANDRRGWWGDQFAEIEGDKIGSRMWLLDRAKRTNETAQKAKEYLTEAFAWMVEDRVVARVDVSFAWMIGERVVTVATTGAALILFVALQRPGRDPVTFRFAHTWDNLQEAA